MTDGPSRKFWRHASRRTVASPARRRMTLESLEERRLLDTTGLSGAAASPHWADTPAVASSFDSPAERLFALRVEDRVGTIYEVDPDSGTELGSYPAPVSVKDSGYQGLALGGESLFFVDGSGTGPHTLYELDPTTGAVIDADLVGDASSAPASGLAYLNGLVYLAHPEDQTLSVWDPDLDQDVGALQVGFGISGGLTGASDLNVLFDSNRHGDLVSISPEDGSVLAHFETGHSLSGGLAYVNGQLLGGSYRSGTIYRIDPGTGAVSGAFSAPGSGDLSGLAGDGATSPSGEISGAIWNDLDGDGQFDANEPGLGGWIAYLDENGNGSRDPEEAYALTDDKGLYAITDVCPGTYAVAEEVDSDWIQTSPGPSPSQGRVFALWSDETTGVGTIVELDPDDGEIINDFYAPSVLSRAGVQGLAVGPDRLYYVEGDSMLLCELDLNTGVLIASHLLSPSHDEPISGLAYLSGTLYLVQHGYDRLLAWDPESETLADIATLTDTDLGGSLTGCPDEGLLFCANGGGEIFGIDPATGSVERSFSTGLLWIRGGMAYLDGELIVGKFSDFETAYRIDPVSGEVLGTFVLDGAEFGLLAGLGGDGAVGTADSSPCFVSVAQGQIVGDCNFGNMAASNSAVFHGTDGDDVFAVTASAAGHVVAVNGTSQVLAPRISEIQINGLDGNDRITIVGTAENEAAAVSPDSTDMLGETYEIHATSVEYVTLEAGAGSDCVALTGSAGSNRLFSYADSTRLSDSPRTFSYRVDGFETVTVDSSAGSRDCVFLYDSEENDILTATPDGVELNREDGRTARSAVGFERVYAYATAGGSDTASLTGADGARNRLYSYAAYTTLTESRRSFYFHARDFDSVSVDSTGAGYAYLYDSAGNDSYEATPDLAAMDRADSWSDVTVGGFSRVHAYATRGGDDWALLTGSTTGGNRYRGYPAYSTLTDASRSFYHYVRGFDAVAATGSQSDSSADLAWLYDSSGDDTLSATFLENGKYQDATLNDTAGTYENRILYFDFVYARSSDHDTADVINLDDETLAYRLILCGTW